MELTVLASIVAATATFPLAAGAAWLLLRFFMAAIAAGGSQLPVNVEFPQARPADVFAVHWPRD